MSAKFWKSIRSAYSDEKQYRLFVFILVIGTLVAVGAAQIFFSLADALREELLDDWDAKVSSWIHAMRAPGITQFMKLVTEFGSVYGYLFLIIIITWYTHHKEKGWGITWQIVAVLTSAGLLSFILKIIIDRDRPQGVKLIEADGLSFPSGHSMSSIAFYGFIIYLAWMHFNRKSVKISISIGLSLFILLIGFSRVYLGVHYPSDVIAGFAAGIAWLAICIWVFNWINHSKIRKLQKAGL